MNPDLEIQGLQLASDALQPLTCRRVAMQGQRHAAPEVQPALPTLHPAKKEAISIYAMRQRQDTSDTVDRDAPVYSMQEYRGSAHLLSVQQKRKMVRSVQYGHS